MCGYSRARTKQGRGVIKEIRYLALSCEQDITRSGKILLNCKTISTRPNRVLPRVACLILAVDVTQDCAKIHVRSYYKIVLLIP